MEALLVSACLLGFDCKYNGGNNALPAETLQKLRARYRLIPICPELMGGLPVPRTPSERRGDRVVSRDGRDVTAEYRRGAELSLRLAQRYDCRKALLKARSPSCGSGQIYDGSFSGMLIPGKGITAGLLESKKMEVFSEEKDEILGFR